MARQSVKDRSYPEYQDSLASSVGEPLSALTLQPSGRYRFHKEAKTWKPITCRGITILAEPYPIGGSVVPALKTLQEKIQQLTPDFAPVPPETFHLTVADLIWGDKYTALIQSQGGEIQNTQMFQRVDDILKGVDGRLLTQNATIVGVGGFPGAVVAFVNVDDAAYRSIITFRDKIYSDLILAQYGVFRERPFLGHITLGYIEGVPPQGLDDALNDIRFTTDFTLPQWTFELSDVGIYRFSNMSEYYQIHGGYLG